MDEDDDSACPYCDGRCYTHCTRCDTPLVRGFCPKCQPEMVAAGSDDPAL